MKGAAGGACVVRDPSHQHEIERASTTEGLPVAPSMLPGLEAVAATRQAAAINSRVVAITGISCGIAVAAALGARLLTGLIGFITNLAFYGRVSFDFVSPAGNRLGGWVVLVPAVCAGVVGVMARHRAQG